MLHMIGNAHIDPVWLWRWPEGCAEAIGTCWSAVDRLEESPGFIFTRGEAQIYAWIEALDPVLFDRIGGYIREGRWVVVNGWWVQPDCNLPSGEAFIRQALYGKRYFANRFGIEVPVGYNVDSFGHAATLPMLLRHTGTDAYVFMRPGPHEMVLPADLFDWVSPDGSRVATFRIPISYGMWSPDMSFAGKIDRHLAMSAAAGHPFMCFYGVGNHGGGPTRESIAAIEARRAAGEPLEFSDPNRFFASVAVVPRPEIKTELQFHAIGCYAAASSLKALNRQAEARLGQAEAAAALANRETGTPYPAAGFETLWRRLLFNQFHDTLGGTAIESACGDAERDFGAVIAGADELLNAALRQLAGTISPAKDQRDATLLIANFNAADFDGLVEAEPWAEFDGASPRLLLDEDEQPVPFQYIAPEASTRGMQRLVFRVEVAGFGYRLLHLARRPDGIAAPAIGGKPLPPPDLVVETAGWRLEIDAKTGALARLSNRAGDFSVFSGPAHLPILVEDATDTWSHGIDRFGLKGTVARLARLRTIEAGPIRRAVEIAATLGDSTTTTTVMLPEDADLPVELRVRLDWRERQKLLRLAYPLGASRFEYEVPAGWTERPDDGREVFGHRWVRAIRQGLTVTLANDAKYSYAADNGTLYVTAARAPVFAHHDPVRLEAGGAYRYMDQGEQAFTLRIDAGPATSRQQSMQLADELLRPPLISPHVGRGGTRPHRGRWLAVRSGSSAVTALKGSENGHGMVLRAVELDGAADELAVGNGAAKLGPRSIVTLRIVGDTVTPSDGLER